MNKSEIRKLFPHIEKGFIYLNHAAISPMSNHVKKALDNFIAARNSGAIDNFQEWMELFEETRGLISNLINSGGTDRITFTQNTSEGLSIVAEGLNWEEDDEIILNTMEFPANIQPFRILERRGVKIVYIEPDDEGKITPEMIENTITPKTRLVSISAVQFLNGFQADLRSIGEICKDNNIFFVVDAIQAVGASTIDVQESKIDALATGCHKWLMSPMGTGFLSLSEELAASLHPSKTGWLSVETPWELFNYNQNWQPVSKHLETGTYNTIGLTGLHASLSYMSDIGFENIQREILKLTRYLFTNISSQGNVTILTPESEENHAGIFTFSLEDGDSKKIVERLKQNQITISERQGFIRISPHFYNTEEELEKVLESIF